MRPGPGDFGQAETQGTWVLWRCNTREGAPRRGRRHRPDQAGPPAGSSCGSTGTHGGRYRRTAHGVPCQDQLQAEDDREPGKLHPDQHRSGAGDLLLSELERAHVSGLHHKLRDTPTQANLTVKVLSSMFRLAEAWDMMPPGRDLCRSVRHYRENSRERFLSSDEYKKLGDVLDAVEVDGSCNPSAIHATRLLLTGCRKDEILTLKWDDVDRASGMLHLRDGKTGLRHVPPWLA